MTKEILHYAVGKYYDLPTGSDTFAILLGLSPSAVTGDKKRRVRSCFFDLRRLKESVKTVLTVLRYVTKHV